MANNKKLLTIDLFEDGGARVHDIENGVYKPVSVSDLVAVLGKDREVQTGFLPVKDSGLLMYGVRGPTHWGVYYEGPQKRKLTWNKGTDSRPKYEDIDLFHPPTIFLFQRSGKTGKIFIRVHTIKSPLFKSNMKVYSADWLGNVFIGDVGGREGSICWGSTGGNREHKAPLFTQLEEMMSRFYSGRFNSHLSGMQFLKAYTESRKWPSGKYKKNVGPNYEAGRELGTLDELIKKYFEVQI